jgi:hypothetical protein
MSPKPMRITTRAKRDLAIKRRLMDGAFRTVSANKKEFSAQRPAA